MKKTKFIFFENQSIRVDSLGNGNYATSRTGHIHQGVDLKIEPNKPIYAPYDCKINRIGYPYSGNTDYKLIELTIDSYTIKVMYITPKVSKGQTVKKGELLGYAQNVAAYYSAGMTNHIHVEFRENGNLINPTNLLV